MDELKDKAHDLLCEYLDKGLSKEEIEECVEFVEIHMDVK